MCEGVHGKKRPAESDPDGDQPLAKRLGRLHIGHLNNDDGPGRREESFASQQDSSGLTDMMMLDDTKHTIYVHDIDQEIEESEPLAGSIAFLPEIGGKLASIPKFLVTDTRPRCNELVLYKEPTSLTVPQEKDYVRKAIIEARKRVRASQNEFQAPCLKDPATSLGDTVQADNSHHGRCAGDTMDIDGLV